MKKVFLILAVLFSSNIFAEDISLQYQDEYGEKACMVFHFKHDRAEVFELITKPTFFKWGAKTFRAVENFREGEIELENGNFDSLCSKVTRTDTEDSSIFTCLDNEDKFIVSFNQNETINGVTYFHKNKEFKCLDLMEPFETN